MHKGNTSYFACVVYLSIAVNHVTDVDPFLFVLNRCFDTVIGIVAMCNRIGREGNMEFSGESIVVGFDGETIVLAGNQEELIFAEVNLGGAAIKRNQRPYTSLRRTDLYE